MRRSTQGDIIDNDPEKAKGQQIYFASLSSRTIVYKGMVMSCVLKQFYKTPGPSHFDTNCPLKALSAHFQTLLTSKMSCTRNQGLLYPAFKGAGSWLRG